MQRAEARTHTTHTYNKGAPATGGPCHLPTTTRVGAQIAWRSDADARTTKFEYDQKNPDGTVTPVGWTHRKPIKTIVDPPA